MTLSILVRYNKLKYFVLDESYVKITYLKKLKHEFKTKVYWKSFLL